MFEFFIALFGGAYFAKKISSEKSSAKKISKKTEEDIAWHTHRKQLWEMQVSDRALEEDLTYFIADPKNYGDIWEEVSDAYKHMPLHADAQEILLTGHTVKRVFGNVFSNKERESIAAMNREKALNIMLARRGKVQHKFTCGLSTPCCYLKPGLGEKSKQEWDKSCEFWLYIQNELRNNGVKAKLIFIAETYESGCFSEKVFDAENVNEFKYQCGNLTWLPLTYYNDTLQKETA